MAITTVKYPDGRTEEISVLTHFVKDGKDFIVFDTGNKVNGNNEVGISYLENGMYQRAMNTEYDNAKKYLVDILKDQMILEDYREVPTEVLVTVDPYQQLALRDENYDKIKEEYEKFLSKEKTTPEINSQIIQIEEPVVQQEVTTSNETIIPDISIAPVASVEEVQDEQIIKPEESIASQELATPNETIIPDIPVAPIASVEDVQNEQIIQSEESIAPQEVVTPSETVIPDIPAAPVTPVEDENVQNQEISVFDAVSDLVDPGYINMGSNEEIVDNNQNNTPITLVDMPTNSENIIPPEGVSINQNQPIESVPEIETPTIITENNQENLVEESAVTNSYLKSTEQIKQEMQKMTQEYIEKIQNISSEYMKKMDEYESEIKNNLEEAKGINDLSKQTFEKAQSMNQNVQTIPPIENNNQQTAQQENNDLGPTLTLAA